MTMQWVRLDTAFPTNPKVLALVEDKQWRSVVTYIGGLAYSGAHGTDGYIQRSGLPFIHGTTKDAERLTDVGLWVPNNGAGWDVNGWAEFQPSNEETQQRKQRAREAAESRWAKK